MKTILLIAGAAAVALTATASQAATRHHVRHHHESMASAGRYAEPKSPIAYDQLAGYLKASPSKRASNDWTGGMAATGANVNAAATTAAPATDVNANGGAGAGMTTQTPAPAATPPVNAAPSDTVAQPPASNAPAQQPQPGPQ